PPVYFKTPPPPPSNSGFIFLPFSALKKFFFNDTATTEIYTNVSSSAASSDYPLRDVYKRQLRE
ncbi:hypothetical protein ACPXCG_23995, partial [Gordonia sp. DT218]|uniref:hypothetical protein n=1 Tax=Gordonia sp. DT218 TaxID=3416659 RepID=UPI003CF65328